MSGKKSSEVADVLASAKKARKMTEGMYDSAFDSYREDIVYCDSRLKNIRNECQDNVVVSQEARELFVSESMAQVEKVKDLQTKIKSAKVDLQGLKSKEQELKNIAKELTACDDEADKIASIIRTKPHYCDEEYRRAERLKEKYQKLAGKRKQIDRDASALVAEAKSVVHQVESWQSQLHGVERIIANLNETAANRKASDGLKKQLQRELKAINVDDAKKFMNQEYVHILALEKALSVKTDVEIIAEAPVVLTTVNKFSSDLQYKVAVWKQQKADAESAKNAAEFPVAATFSDPLDYWAEKENRFEVFAYLSKYISSDYETKYSKLSCEAADAMKKEQFVEAKKLYNQMESIAVEARGCAAQLQERMIKSADIAFIVEEVMHGENYDTRWVTINDNPNDGFKIICTVGDETIDFNITFDGDKPCLNSDDTEAQNGSCKNTWSSLVKKFRAQGLPITDVKKNGKSILREEPIPHPGVRQKPGQQRENQGSGNVARR